MGEGCHLHLLRMNCCTIGPGVFRPYSQLRNVSTATSSSAEAWACVSLRRLRHDLINSGISFMCEHITRVEYLSQHFFLDCFLLHDNVVEMKPIEQRVTQLEQLTRLVVACLVVIMTILVMITYILI